MVNYIDCLLVINPTWLLCINFLQINIFALSFYFFKRIFSCMYMRKFGQDSSYNVLIQFTITCFSPLLYESTWGGYYFFPWMFNEILQKSDLSLVFSLWEVLFNRYSAIQIFHFFLIQFWYIVSVKDFSICLSCQIY